MKTSNHEDGNFLCGEGIETAGMLSLRHAVCMDDQLLPRHTNPLHWRFESLNVEIPVMEKVLQSQHNLGPDVVGYCATTINLLLHHKGGKFHYIGGSVWHEPAEKVLVCGFSSNEPAEKELFCVVV